MLVYGDSAGRKWKKGKFNMPGGSQEQQPVSVIYTSPKKTTRKKIVLVSTIYVKVQLMHLIKCFLRLDLPFILTAINVYMTRIYIT